MVEIKPLVWKTIAAADGSQEWVGIVGNSIHGKITMHKGFYVCCGVPFDTLEQAQEAARMNHRRYVMGLVSLAH